MPEYAAKLKGTTEGGRWMTAATKQKATVGVVTAVSTIGVSAVLVLWGFPWMMKQVEQSRLDSQRQGQAAQDFSQTKLVEMLEKSIGATDRSTAATQAQTSVMGQQTNRLDDLCESHEYLCIKLDKLIEIHTEAAK